MHLFKVEFEITMPNTFPYQQTKVGINLIKTVFCPLKMDKTAQSPEVHSRHSREVSTES